MAETVPAVDNYSEEYFFSNLQAQITSLQQFFQRVSTPFEHEMSSVQDMNQFGVMNEDVVEVNLGIENDVTKTKMASGKEMRVLCVNQMNWRQETLLLALPQDGREKDSIGIRN
ncbi:hypothetical protein HGM15179_001487 [Zosterops borbonicus]|uniref:Uncharacterized protein n=1 Tax=Zosterops borbonicus TaxID=364589 RepID=A0A8K1GXI0_9PASS|nr:hypothetical protein HGM15179_001487 [Zosterops borbonicus]